MFDPCLSPLRSLYCRSPPPGFGFYCFSQHRSGNQTQRFAAGSKGPERCRGGIKRERSLAHHPCHKVLATSHGTAAEPRFSLQLIGNPGTSSENSCPAGHRDKDTRGTERDGAPQPHVGLGWGRAVRGGSISKTPLLASSTWPSVTCEGHRGSPSLRGTGHQQPRYLLRFQL